MPEQIERPRRRNPAGFSENATCGLGLSDLHSGDHLPGGRPLQPESKVRFHSWQSIFLAIAAFAACDCAPVIWMIPVVNFINIILHPVVVVGVLCPVARCDDQWPSRVKRFKIPVLVRLGGQAGRACNRVPFRHEARRFSAACRGRTSFARSTACWRGCFAALLLRLGRRLGVVACR